jgi:uncharacterized membrane protein
MARSMALCARGNNTTGATMGHEGSQKTHAHDGEKETGRLEAFSDGVFAIAITLLVLELHVPKDIEGHEALLDALARQWPMYLAFLNSFITIGIMWVNHHRLFTHIRRADHTLLMLNLLLLLVVTIVPFPTALLAENLGKPDAQTATAVYAASGFAIAIAYNLLWRYATKDKRLLHHDVDMTATAAISHQYAFGPLMYVVCFGLAFLNATVSLVGLMVLALFFALPPRGPKMSPHEFR